MIVIYAIAIFFPFDSLDNPVAATSLVFDIDVFPLLLILFLFLAFSLFRSKIQTSLIVSLIINFYYLFYEVHFILTCINNAIQFYNGMSDGLIGTSCIGEFLILFVWIGTASLTLLLYILKLKDNKAQIFTIKKTIFDLGMKYTRLEVREISEKAGQDSELVLKTLNDMIKNKEIYAQYFNTTRTITFNQLANLKEIDNLMVKFREWEEKAVEKIIEKP